MEIVNNSAPGCNAINLYSDFVLLSKYWPRLKSFTILS